MESTVNTTDKDVTQNRVSIEKSISDFLANEGEADVSSVYNASGVAPAGEADAKVGTAAVSGAGAETGQGAGAGAKAVTAPGAVAGAESAVKTEWKPNYGWEVLKRALNTEESSYEIPEHIVRGVKKDGTALTQDEEFEELVNNIVANINVHDDDPFIASYKVARTDKEFNFENFIDKYRSKLDILNLDSKDFLREYMKIQSETQKKNWTESDINEYLNARNKIEIDQMADSARDSYRKYISSQENAKYEQKKSELKNQRAQRIKDINTENHSRANALATELAKEPTIGGITHGQADIDEFLPLFREMVSINPETGMPNVRNLFSDDKTLYKVLYLYHKMEKGAFTDIKEKAKQEVLDKTGLQKKSEGGIQKTFKVPKAEDFIS